MTEAAATETASPAVPAAATATTPQPVVAPSGDAAAARPEWLAEDKFWDGEAKAVKSADIYKSYRELQGAFGKRIHDLSPEARKALTASVPDDMREAWSKELRATLAEDPEFLTPLQEKWLSEKLPKAPEAYAVPDELAIDGEHPAAVTLMEVAKEYGLPQEAFEKLAAMGRDLMAPYEKVWGVEDVKQVFGPGTEARVMAVGNRIRSLVGEEPGNAMMRELMKTPESFVAFEKLVRLSSEQPLPMGGEPTPSNGGWTPEKLRNAPMDPRYIARDQDFIDEVERAFHVVYPSDRV